MKKLIYILFALSVLSIALFTSCSEDSNSPDSQTVEGVLEYDDGSQIGNALVEAGDIDFNEILSKDTTDNEGNFILTGLPIDISELYVRVKIENKIKAILKISDIQKESEGNSDKKIRIKLLSEDTCCAELKITVKNGDDFIKEAEVRLNKGDDVIEKKYSDENGEVKFDEICEGEYWVRIAKDGFNVVEKEISLDSCESKEYEIQLTEEEDCCGKLQIRAIDKETEEAISNAQVKVTLGEEIIETLKTDESGYVKFDGLCLDKEYHLRIYKEGYNVIEESVKLTTCEEWKELTFKLQSKEEEDCCGKLQIRAIDKETEEAISNAQVKVTKGGEIIETLKTDESGYVKFDGLCLDKEYHLRIYKEGYNVIEESVKLTTCEEWKELTFKLQSKEEEDCCGKLQIRAIDKETEEAISNAQVKVTLGEEIIETLKTDESGYVKFDGLCLDKEYHLRIYKEGYNVIEESVKLTTCEEWKELTFKLQSKEEDCCEGSLKVVTKDSESGEVITGVKVRLWKNGQLIKEIKSTEEGVLFTDLCEGKYGLSFIHENYNNPEMEFELGCNQEKEIVKELQSKEEEDCCGKLQILAIDKETEEAISNAQVKVTKGGEIIETLKTDESGYVKFDGLCLDKEYHLRIYKEGYNVIEESVKLTTCEEWKELTFKLQSKEEDCCDNKIKVSARDFDSEELLKGAEITLWQNGQKIQVKELENEWIIFEEVCKGVYWIDIVIEGYEGIEWEIEVDCGDFKEFSKKLKKK